MFWGYAPGMPDADDAAPATGRAALEELIGDDVRAFAAEAEEIGRAFADRHDLSTNDFRALLQIIIAQSAGSPLTAGELRREMRMSGAAITYLVERLIGSGHILRGSDPLDRRKVILRYADHGFDVARAFFGPLEEHNRQAMADLPDGDLEAARRTLTALVAAMRAFRAELRSPDVNPG